MTDVRSALQLQKTQGEEATALFVCPSYSNPTILSAGPLGLLILGFLAAVFVVRRRRKKEKERS